MHTESAEHISIGKSSSQHQDLKTALFEFIKVAKVYSMEYNMYETCCERLKRTMKKKFQEFCELTSLHGFNFFPYKNFRPFDTFMWICVFFIDYIAVIWLITLHGQSKKMVSMLLILRACISITVNSGIKRVNKRTFSYNVKLKC